jgi:hypothetical protein
MKKKSSLLPIVGTLMLGALVISGCSAVDETEPDSATQEETEVNVQPDELVEEELDRTEGVDNDPVLVERLFNMAEATCDFAREQGMTSTTEAMAARTVFIPEDKQSGGFTGFAESLSEDAGIVLVRGAHQFAECSLYTNAQNSIETYGEAFANVQLSEENGAVTFDFLFNNYRESVVHTVNEDNVLQRIDSLDVAGDVRISTIFEPGVSDEDLAKYENLLSSE